MWHEMDEFAANESTSEDPRDLVAWRHEERQRQIAARLKMPLRERVSASTRISEALVSAFRSLDARTVSLYWPIRGEPDLRSLIADIIAKGGRCALPVVVNRRKPLVFRQWQPGEHLEPGVWNIPVPTMGLEVEPDIVIAPLVAYDQAGFRLGYGGGYFDRTLASLGGRPHVIGVGFSAAAIATIYPQPHDIAMDQIVTEEGVLTP